ncbi:hypothetical protein F441_09387 [Phytophthora nicotianae CJ01A1]|uniref:PHD-type domain-containing protein n=5 Tax=Phytophthora nicotianae TaxID=4792 RepID=W2Q611_PHYN3|nr:hypothetical protein PPTG_12355 [Phytophthora nicotianae INRA-310]ETI46153.1 hypothetical protein F443_09427 [Phytophthora nicotianae P1569]ETK86100.1 hypothetical protein L915_09246 [Phytophthora nicotianae]ETO74830.1 hypothetical protein F444_09512 [Phytophthora nicotianae P1976]ETP15963.1 hypothetical protein F441_09387 [Phytophthora nicotianae CJ01A1]KUF90985.1 Chromatin modification-related protein YNG2 [Phytophthora nicotianae]
MDEHDDLYMMEEELDDGRYYDDVDDLSSQQRLKRVLYPPRLMVDFKSLGVEALRRYAKFYHLKFDDDADKEELAAQVARHFDMSLEVEEDDSIVAFMQRLRNGERTAVKRSTVREKERKAQAAADKAKRKSNSRKRQRDHSVSVSSGRNTNNSSSHNTSNGNSGNSSTHHSHSSGSSNGHSGRSEGRKAPPSSSKPANSSGKNKKNKKDADTGEDNELYCICNLPSYGNMIACDGKTCPNPSQWYHLECVGLADGRHPDTWLCPECDPKGFSGGSSNSHKKKKNKRSKSPGNK